MIALTMLAVCAQNEEKKQAAAIDAKRVMWEQVNIAERNLFWGAGGQQMQPDMKKSQFLGRQTGGNNLKYRIKDAAGREWVVKIADESQPEIAATRLLWAIGYHTEIDYLVPRLSINRIGNYKNARFEARPESVKRLEKWSWLNNPFAGTNEFEGLKIMMAMFNNWDIKDENTAILEDGGTHYYIVSDLGSSFGKLSEVSGGRAGRSVNKPEHYAESRFIKQVREGVLELDYRGKADNLIKTAKVEHGRWLADLLLQLSDNQIEDAFRAANYKAEDVTLLASAFKTRIKELDEATRQAANTAQQNQ
jgi:hypothetical protein